jgi:hypothetical protein
VGTFANENVKDLQQTRRRQIRGCRQEITEPFTIEVDNLKSPRSAFCQNRKNCVKTQLGCNKACRRVDTFAYRASFIFPPLIP